MSAWIFHGRRLVHNIHVGILHKIVALCANSFIRFRPVPNSIFELLCLAPACVHGFLVTESHACGIVAVERNLYNACFFLSKFH